MGNIPLGFPRGTTWRSDGAIIFALAGGNIDRSGVLHEISEQGGEPVVMAVTDTSRGDEGIICPSILPDGQSVLYATTDGSQSDLGVQNDRSGTIPVNV